MGVGPRVCVLAHATLRVLKALTYFFKFPNRFKSEVIMTVYVFLFTHNITQYNYTKYNFSFSLLLSRVKILRSIVRSK